MNNLEYYILIDDINNKCLRQYNIFNNYYIDKFIKNYKKIYLKNKDKQEFLDALNRELMYAFWSKCEYELMIGDLFGAYNKKVDVYERLKGNVALIADMIIRHWEGDK